MKTMKIGSAFLILATLSPVAMQAYNTNQAADVVVGQLNMTSNSSGVTASSLGAVFSYCDGTRLFVSDVTNNRVLIYNSVPASNNAAANIVIGQPNMTSNIANNGGISASSLNGSAGVYNDGTRLFITDFSNNRVLIYNSIPTSNNAAASIVVGQPNMSSNASNQGGVVNANTLFGPAGVYSDGTRLFVADENNNRILIYNSIPTGNNASASLVIGQTYMTSGGSGVSANALYNPREAYIDGTSLLVADQGNNRVLIYNSIPTANNATANFVVGQPNMTSNAVNQGGEVGANTLADPNDVFSDGTRLFVADGMNFRVLIYNTIPQVNNAAADIVVGQPNMTSRNSLVNANTLGLTGSVCAKGNRLIVGDVFNARVLIFFYPQLALVSPNYGMLGKAIQMSISGAFPTLELFRGGYPNISDVNVVYNNFSTTYTLNLTASALYDVVANVNGTQRTLKQAYTVLTPLTPPIAWKINPLGQAGTQTSASNPCSLDIGDGDQDNSQELYVANQDQTLYMFKRNSGVWNCSGLTAQSGANLGRVLLADGNGDGAWEAYGASSAGTHPFQFQYSSGWQKTDMGAGYAGGNQISALAQADLDHDGNVEIYAAETNGVASSDISQFKYTGTGWAEADIPGCSSYPAKALAAGDGYNDGNLELFSANTDGSIYQHKLNGITWQVSVLGTGTGIMYGVAVGDGDNDGKNEVYAANKNGCVYQYVHGTSGWTSHTIGQAVGNALYAIAVSDGENAGSNQVYAACGDGHVYEYKYQSGIWTRSDLGNAGTPLYALAIGDADNDHQFEVYALGQNNQVYQFKAGLAPTATPTPTVTITPTASPTMTITPTPSPTSTPVLSATITLTTTITVTATTTPTLVPSSTSTITSVPDAFKKMKILHSQINPLHGELARVRWFQADGAPVTLEIYNLLGDKVATLAENRLLNPGLQEVTWNGKTSRGAVAGSGIYIVYLQTGDTKTWAKVAVVK